MRALHDHLLADEGQSSLRDFKGRNVGDALLAGIPGQVEDELFRVGGTIATEQLGDDFEWSPFDLSCHATFNAFEGTHHIRYTTGLHRSESVPSWLPWRLIGAAAPIRPAYFRVGLERFQSKFTLSSIGFMPQITDSFLIDGAGGIVHVRLKTEQTAWKPSNPAEELPAFHALAQALQSAVGFNLSDSFRDELARAAKFRGKR
jgi:hypothetical protein